ncbi:sugar-binding protein [Halalkalibacter kiskunsagensis]|uniref:Sugar-binding protein n=1 Tax=Halalkalibacter kiskunsagensis TaxID=1548599 RepID=A0ABV6KJ28_9BACI
MKDNYYIHVFFAVVIGISLIFTYHFFMKTVDFDVSIQASENVRNSDYHFVLIVQELENPYLQELYKGAQDAANKKGVTIEYMGTKQTNINDHIKLIEMAIAAKVDGILTQGLSNEFLPVIEKAKEKEIPLIMVDSDLKNNELIPYVGTNNYQAGYDIGATVLNETIGKTKIGILTGSLIANNLKERVQGFLDAIEQEERLQVVAIESSNLSKIQGAEKTYQMIKNDSDISIFFGTSALDSLGIAEGIKKTNPSTAIRVYAFDMLEETIELFKNDHIHATLKQEPYEMGRTGVHLLFDSLQGIEVKREYHTPTTIIRKEDVEDEF